MQLSRFERVLSELIIWPYIGFIIGVATIFFAGMHGIEDYLLPTLITGIVVGVLRALALVVGVIKFKSKQLSKNRLYFCRVGLALMYGVMIYSVAWPRY